MQDKKIKVCIIGAGNISNTRHIPALKKIKNVEILGVISDNIKNIEKTQNKYHFPNQLVVDDPKNNIDKLRNCSWFKDIDAVVIGAPPHQHYPLVKLSLLLDKHVMVEKPMMMNVDECKELIDLAKKKKKIFSVMHNFQFASDMKKLNKIISEKKSDEIQAITEIQFTNRKRRLPVWYNELPLGLFYDEAAHFIYLLEKHAGTVTIENVHATYNINKEATPSTLSVTAKAGNVPVQILMNLNSPICEWYYIVSFEKELYFYDFFKDILIKVPTDNEHYSKDVLKVDLKFTFQYWAKFARNGFRMLAGNLLYGHDEALEVFINSIVNNKPNKDISAEQGMNNVRVLNEIVDKANKNE